MTTGVTVMSAGSAWVRILQARLQATAMIPKLPVWLALLALMLITASTRIAAETLSMEAVEEPVIVGFPEKFPPYHDLDTNNQAVGFALDVIREVAKRAGLTLILKPYPNWSETHLALKNGDIDVIPNMGISADRKKIALFTDPVETFSISVFVRKESHHLQSLQDLGEKSIAVVKSNAAISILKQKNHLKIVEFDTLSEAIFALIAGRVEGLAYPAPLLLRELQSIKLENTVRALEPALKEIKRAIAVHINKPQLQRKLQSVLTGFIHSDEYRQIYLKWFAVAEPFWTAMKVFWVMLIAAILIALALMVWRYFSLLNFNRELKVETEQRRRAENELRSMNENLEDRVQQRTAELSASRAKIQQAATVFETTADGVAITDREGTILDVNEGFSRITGYSREEVLGRNPRLLKSGRHAPEFYDEMWKKILESGYWRGEIWNRRKDGSEYVELLSISSVRGHTESEVSYVGVFSDITLLKQAEEERAHYQQNLERDVRLRTYELETANKDLEGFSYSVSHDLRSPLRAIDGFVSILVEDYAPQLDQEGKRLLKIVSANANKMGRLIDDILQFSRAGRAEMEITSIDMDKLLDEAWESLAAQRGDLNYQFEHTPLPVVKGDVRALRQVWQNLLSNAIKFSAQVAQPQISVSAERDQQATRFSVRDNGVGFNQDYVDKLFVLFQRLHGMDEYEGTGVGLAIVKRFVQKHGGRIDASATPNQGACFSFTLPDNPTIKHLIKKHLDESK